MQCPLRLVDVADRIVLGQFPQWRESMLLPEKLTPFPVLVGWVE